MNFPNEFKDVVINYNNKNFNVALKLLNDIPKKNEGKKYYDFLYKRKKSL